ncbi:MAG: hypothetical protein HUU28_00845 [Planctomycetaceae bacterium]|nr:hypothetical protein [Planctomycetaceae bacterium]
MAPSTSEATLERVRSKRLLLTVTTGRSGTGHLAKVLACFPGVKSEHEPKPTFGSAMRTVQQTPAAAREFWLEHKLPRIAAVRAPVYAETSHLVCKGFLESAVELRLQMSWIELVRPARAVARSLCSLGTIPGRTFAGTKYYLSPFDARVRLAVPHERASRLSDYQLAYWYCLELGERARELEALAKANGIGWVRCELEQLAATDGALALGRSLDLGEPSTVGRLRLAALSSRPSNRKEHLKARFELADDECEHEEREVRALVGR